MTNSRGPSEGAQGPDHFARKEYDDKARFASYWHQVTEVLEAGPETILEVGIGNRFLCEHLRKRNLRVSTCDIDARVKPEVVGSVTALPFKPATFDMVVSFEVLEHLPYEVFCAALRELSRVSRGPVIISLPDLTRHVFLHVKLPWIGAHSWLVACNWHPPETVCTVGEHYWEIGVRGYPLRRICGDIERAGLRLVRSYRVVECPLHRFFVLEPRGSSEVDLAAAKARP